ncbi:MAG: ComEC/Rec2 family competence protein [Clostridia bacterium]|nr:ComEC/Rec2 family competence protein [Clostridia bacterium]
MKRPFAVIGFTVFLTVAFLFDKKTGVTAVALAAFTVALVIALLLKKLRYAKTIPICMASGMVACVIVLASNGLFAAPVSSFAGKILPLKARIVSEAELQYGNYYYEAETVSIDGKEIETDIRLVFSVQPDVEPYDYVDGEFVFYQPGSGSEALLDSNRANGLILGAYPFNGDIKIVKTPSSEKPFGMKIIQLRNSIRRAVFRTFPDENGALAIAMLLGDKHYIPDEIYNDMRLAGIVHIICVSGLHLSLWASVIIGFLRKLRINKTVTCIVAAIGVIGFMVITGLSYSVVRAGVMALAYLFADLITRKSDSINSLGFSLLVLTVFMPYSHASAALQLSVLSTLGILLYNEYVYPRIYGFFRKRGNNFFFNSVRAVLNALLVTVSAILMAEPVMARISDGFSYAAIISNLIITPFAGAAMATSAAASVVSAVLPVRFNIFYYPAKLFLQYIIGSSSLVAEMDFLCVGIGETESYALLGVVFLFVAVAIICSLVYSPKCVTAYFLACAVFFSGLVSASVMKGNETEIRVFDTGNGLSVLFEYNRKSLLVGCGGTTFFGGVNICNVLKDTAVPEAMIIPSSHEMKAAYLLSVINNKRPETVFADSLPYEAGLLLDRSKINGLTGNFESDTFRVDFHNVNGKCFLLVETDDVSALVCSFPGETLADLPEKFRYADIVISRSDYPADITDYPVKLSVVCADNRRGMLVCNELESKGLFCASTAGCGDLMITAENGAVSIRRD